MNKKFSELTKAQQEQKLAEYKQKAQEKGVETRFCAILKSELKNNRNGSYRYVFRLQDIVNDIYFTASVYIPVDKPKVLAFYKSLKAGQLVNAELRKHEFNGKMYYNIWNMYLRNSK